MILFKEDVHSYKGKKFPNANCLDNLPKQLEWISAEWEKL